MISLRHGTFTSVNGESSEEDAAAIVCPSDNKEWAAQKNSGAEWKVELPDEMKGIHPTKARIYILKGQMVSNYLEFILIQQWYYEFNLY